MATAIITGSAGLIGSEAARHFAGLGLDVVGVDNDMRSYFFGETASTGWNAQALARELQGRYTHAELDIRDREGIARLFARYGRDVSLVVHTAAQPSHDWAAKEPTTDFDINAVGTLNVLDATRSHCPDAAFIFTSTNKVYGDTPNRLPLQELDTRYELPADHPYWPGIPEDMSIDQTLHSIFGASKVAADVLVQEYGRYFGMATACFRGGTLTGPRHSAAELHGFLAYVMRCAMTGRKYTVFGYKGKQVRDAIHSEDLVRAFAAFHASPRHAEVYNIGGGRESNCSVLEAIALCEEISGRTMNWEYSESHRTGDHLWWIGSNQRFEEHYPEWSVKHDLPSIASAIHDANQDRWR